MRQYHSGEYIFLFYERIHFSNAMGIVTVVGGLVGTGLGGWLGDFFVGKTRIPFLAASGLGIRLFTKVVFGAI